MEILFEIFGEAILQILVEAAVELGLSRFRRDSRPRMHPAFAACGYFAWGLIAGAISLWPLPHSFVANHGFRVLNLFATPLCAGAVMMLIGKWKEGREKPLVRLDRFGYAFAFAFGMALVRFFFAS